VPKDFFASAVCCCSSSYGVAAISRLPQFLGFFCERGLQQQDFFAGKTYNSGESINRCHCHPIYLIMDRFEPVALPTLFSGRKKDRENERERAHARARTREKEREEKRESVAGGGGENEKGRKQREGRREREY